MLYCEGTFCMQNMSFLIMIIEKKNQIWNAVYMKKEWVRDVLIKVRVDWGPELPLKELWRRKSRFHCIAPVKYTNIQHKHNDNINPMILLKNNPLMWVLSIKAASEHTVVKNVNTKYETWIQNESDIASFQPHYSPNIPVA